MPQIEYRANLASAQFPFDTANQQGQTIIVGGQDQNFSRQLAARADQDRSVGIPQVFAMRNCMPVDQGYASIRTDARFVVSSGSFSTYNSNGIGLSFKSAFGPSVFNLDRVHRATGVVATATGIRSVYVLNGIEYAFTSGDQLYSLGLLTATLQVRTGLPAGVVDMNSAFGYNLAITATTFYWSSTTNPLDFVPSLVSGAGNFGVQQAAGALVALLPAASGVFIVCENNIVFMRYTGNPRFPFAAQAIQGSVGTGESANTLKRMFAPVFEPTDQKWLLAVDGTIHRLTPTQCTPEFPEVSQFLQSGQIRDFPVSSQYVYPSVAKFDLLPGAFNIVPLSVQYIVNRYLLIAFTTGSLGYITLVYDFLLQRWGVLEINTLLALDNSGTQGIGVIFNSVGTPQYRKYILHPPATTDTTVVTHGSLVMGRYQYVRNRMLELQSVDIQGGPPTLRALCSLKGDNVTTAVSPTAIERSGRQTRYFFNNAVGFNISLLLEGQFNVTSAVLRFNVHGKAMMS